MSKECFQQLARLLENEGLVFQNHVLEMVRDVIEDSDVHRGIMSLHANSLPARDVSDFLEHLPPAHGYRAQSEPLQQLLTLVQGLKPDSHASQAHIAELIAGELIHRKLWEEALERNPGTLPALKRKLSL